MAARFVDSGAGNEARKYLLFAHKCLLGATVTAEANTARMTMPPAIATLSRSANLMNRLSLVSHCGLAKYDSCITEVKCKFGDGPENSTRPAPVPRED